MGCCRKEKLKEKNVVSCPLCKDLAVDISNMVVKNVVKKDIKALIIENEYFACRNSNCEVVFFTNDNQQIVLYQDIDYTSDFYTVTGIYKGCSNCGGSCSK